MVPLFLTPGAQRTCTRYPFCLRTPPKAAGFHGPHVHHHRFHPSHPSFAATTVVPFGCSVSTAAPRFTHQSAARMSFCDHKSHITHLPTTFQQGLLARGVRRNCSPDVQSPKLARVPATPLGSVVEVPPPGRPCLASAGQAAPGRLHCSLTSPTHHQGPPKLEKPHCQLSALIQCIQYDTWYFWYLIFLVCTFDSLVGTPLRGGVI